jgi:2-oxo-3-hexenedioate decarboxylase
MHFRSNALAACCGKTATMDLSNQLLKTKGIGMDLPSAQVGFGLAEAYKVAHDLYKAQVAAGKTLAGRKIGISNRAAWAKLGLKDIVWGYVFTDTVYEAKDNHFSFPLTGLVQPKLEPEFVFGLKKDLPKDTRDANKLLESLSWVALGFEVVQCPYPGWVFKPADLVATFGFHGALIVGEKFAVNPDIASVFASCQAVLRKDKQVVAEGGGSNVVDSPVIALGHLADLIALDPAAQVLQPGELVTTGTLTAAPSIAFGESYEITVTDLGLPKLSISFV